MTGDAACNGIRECLTSLRSARADMAGIITEAIREKMPGSTNIYDAEHFVPESIRRPNRIIIFVEVGR